jgi:AsmA family protein
MNGLLVLRRGLIAAAVALTVLLFVAAGLVAALDAGHFHGLLVGYFERQTGRQIQVAGLLRIKLLAFRPQLIAQQVTIGNPPWTPPGVTAKIGKLTVTFSIPGSGRSFGIDSLSMEAATFDLFRDAAGRANWQRRDPRDGVNKGLPLIRALSIPDAHLLLEDQRRHLQFDGRVSARDAAGAGPQPLLIEGSGQLNGKSATVEFRGDPLPLAAHDKPYHFTFDERSSGSRLFATGSLPRPFDLGAVDASYEVAGADLKDLYFLTGVGLVNTGSYHLSGKYTRRGTHTQFSELDLATGQTDAQGTLSVEDTGARPKLEADLTSRQLRLADLGTRAAGRGSETASAPPMLLSNVAVNSQAMRRGDALIHFQARRLEVGRTNLTDFSDKVVVDSGVLVALPVSAGVLGGKLNARLKLDVSADPPVSELELKIDDLQLAQLNRKPSAPPPVEGPLRVVLAITGRGSSVHQVAASAEGTATLSLPEGTIRTSLAELTGINLRGLGLMLEKNQQETAIRCGAANFSVHEGIFHVQRMLLDTQPVLISGAGEVRMANETLDLTIRGEPKSLRILRLEAPVLVGGTLTHPAIHIQKHDSKLVLVDRGRAQDEDCAALVK